MQMPPRMPPVPILPERRYGSLRTIASSCVFSAWLSLVLSLLFGFGMLAVPTPTLPTPVPGYGQRLPDGGDLENPLSGSPGGGLGGLGGLLSLTSGLRVTGGILTIGGGVMGFFCLIALGYGLHLLLDMEENTRITAQALAQIEIGRASCRERV